MDSTTITAATTAAGALVGGSLTALGLYLNGRLKAKTESENLRMAAEAAAKKQYDERADKGYVYLIDQQGKRIQELETANVRISNEHFLCGQKLAGYEVQVVSLLDDIKQFRDRENDYVNRIVKLERAVGIGSDTKKAP